MSEEKAAWLPLVFADQEALRRHLDALNEAGVHPKAVGIDACPSPFLITLVGPYAESEHVFLDSPWQGDVDWQNGSQWCEDCRGHVHGIEDLRYPVTVMPQPLTDQERGCYVSALAELVAMADD